MAAIFGSGATVDAAGAVLALNGVVEDPTPVPGVPAEDVPAPLPEGESAVPDGDPPAPSAEPATPTDPAAAPSAAEDEGEDGLILPPTTKSQRQFVRGLVRDNAVYRQQVPQLQQQIATLTQLLNDLRREPAAPVQPTAPPVVVPTTALPPQPEAFATHAEYMLALTSFAADQAVNHAMAERDALDKAHQAERQRETEAQAVAERQRAWQGKMAAGRAQFADFDYVIGNPSTTLAPVVQPIVVETILESDVGPAILHYLGSQPSVTAHLNTVGPLGAARLLGQIEAMIQQAQQPTPEPTPEPTPTPEPAPTPVPVVVTLPPAPLQPVGGGQAPAPPVQFQRGMTLGDYERMRQAQAPRR